MQISDRGGIAQVCVAGKSREGQGLRAAWRRLNQPSVLITHHSTDLLECGLSKRGQDDPSTA